MSAVTEGERLRARVRESLLERVGGDGWAESGLSRRFVLVELVRECGAGIEATVSIDSGVRMPDRAPVRVSGLYVGVTSGALRALEPLLGAGFGSWVVRAEVDRDGVVHPFGEEERVEEPADELGSITPAEWEISSDSDALQAAASLAELITAHGTDLARRFATVDALIATLDRHDGVDLQLPALLAAAGRLEEARVALDRYARPADSDWDAREVGREERRAAYQLRRWIQSGGDPSLMPDAPPPSRYDARSSRSSFAQVRARARLRDEAVKATRARAAVGDRDRAREILLEELDARSVVESPLGIERTLDHLWDTPADQLRHGLQSAKTVARFGLRVVKALRDRELPDLPSSPVWLDPPDPAFYELPRSERWIAASLDPESEPWLDTVHQVAKPSFAGIAALDVWLTTGPAGDGEPIVVYVGERRVGTVPTAYHSVYQPVLQAAAFRAEHVRLEAHLARNQRAPRYLLEIGLPPAD